MENAELKQITEWVEKYIGKDIENIKETINIIHISLKEIMNQNNDRQGDVIKIQKDLNNIFEKCNKEELARYQKDIEIEDSVSRLQKEITKISIKNFKTALVMSTISAGISAGIGFAIGYYLK